MEICKNNICLISTVNSVALYKRTISFFPENIKLFAIDGSDGLFGVNSIKFMFKKLKKYKFKWLIMADEDVIFVNPENVFDIIHNLEKEGYDVCGVRDGGLLSWRNKNPYVINPFFCILNIEKIYPIYSEKEFLKNQYIKKNEFDDDLSELKYVFDRKSLYEDYYCFFLWLRRKNFKFKFLKASSAGFKNDLESTAVFGLDNEILFYHTWYGRTYGINNAHTDRIDLVIEKGHFQKEFSLRKIIYLKSFYFWLRKRSYKLFRRFFTFFFHK